MTMTEQLKAVDGPGPSEPRVRPFRLRPRFAARVWGRHDLEPWYGASDVASDETVLETEKVGEAWLTGPECVVETGDRTGTTMGEMAKLYPGQLGNGEYPLLVKMLFPDEKLSVQVHPDDAQAQAKGLNRGKTECWYVLEAAPGAEVACGLKHGVGVEDVRKSIDDGTLEQKLEMVPVTDGDMVFVDAGTVHAIGPGVVLLEVQQTCDCTYRLFDYGRPRELHLDDGLSVMKLKTKAGKVKPESWDDFKRLIESEYFVVDRFELRAGQTLEMPMDGIGCVVGLKGKAAVNEVEFGPGYAVVVPEGSVTVSSKDGAVMVRCWEPGK
jgi:mannose-6-phosphate isomerase